MLIKYFKYTILFVLVHNLYANPVRIMPLGDSITLGYPYASGYRSTLWYQLNDAGYKVDFVGSNIDGYAVTPSFDYDHEGYNYFKTYDISEIVYGLLEENEPDIILLHIGSNDVSPTQGLNSSSTEHLNNILNQIDVYEQTYNHKIKVLLATIINRKVFHPTVVYYNINLINLLNTRLANGDDIVLVEMGEKADLQSYDYADSTHPNTNGYKKMAKIWFEKLNIILPTLGPQNPLIKPFVERFYTTILLRSSDLAGLTYWSNGLQSCNLTASDLARGFIFSDEFINRDTTDMDFIKILYTAFFDRASDSSGLNYWLEQLAEGKSRFFVLNGFLYSPEFHKLSSQSDILAVHPAELFVTRFYTKVLERDPEEEGLIHWIQQLRSQSISAQYLAQAFFFSDEFINKNVDNTTFITLLYRTLLDREADQKGLNNWITRLQLGQSRTLILDSFINSKEFKALAKSYNIKLK